MLPGQFGKTTGLSIIFHLHVVGWIIENCGRDKIAGLSGKQLDRCCRLPFDGSNGTSINPLSLQLLAMKNISFQKSGILFGIIGAALFSTKPVLIKFIYVYDVSPAVLMALRMGFSLPFYLVFAVLAFQQRKRENTPTDYSVRTLMITALIGVNGYYVASYLDLEGLTRITAQFERLILFTYPIFVSILGAVFLGIPITRQVFLSLVLTYSGLAVIFTHDLHDLGPEVVTGSLLVLVAGILFAGYVVFSKGPINRLGSRLFTCFAMMAASFAILVHFLIMNDVSELQQPWQVYGLVMAIAVFSTVLPTFLIAEAIARIGPGPTSIMGSVGPVFTSLMAVFVLGEKFGIAHLIGTVLIVAGIIWLARKPQPPI